MRGARRLALLDAALRLPGAPASSRRSRTRSPPAALRHADAVRALSLFTARLVEETTRPSCRGPVSRPTATSRSSPSGPCRPLPERAVGAVRRRARADKNVDGLVAAWRRVADRVPERAARRRRRGSLRARSWRGSPSELPGRVEHDRGAAAGGGRRADRRVRRCSSCRRAHEGLGRVVIESVRARPRGRREPRRRRRSTSSRRRPGPARADPEDTDGAGRRARPRPLGTRRSRSGSAPPRARASRRSASPLEPDYADADRRAHAGSVDAA